MTRAKRCSAFCLAAALALAAAPASAGQEDAATLFAEGRRLRAEGRCADAIVAFQRALATYPEGLGSLRNIAECQEAIGKIASARRSWWDLRRALLKNPAERYEGWVADAEQAHARLDDRVPRFRIELRGVDPDEVAIEVNDEAVDPALLHTFLERDPGEHRIAIVHDGRVIARRQVLLSATSRDIVVTIDVSLPDPPPPPPRPAPVQGPDEPMDGGWPDAPAIAGLTFLGVGAAAFAGMGVALGVRATALSDLEKACPLHAEVVCRPEVTPIVDRGNTAATLVNVFAVAGGVATAIGATLTIVSLSGEEPAATMRLELRGGYVGIEAAF